MPQTFVFRLGLVPS